MDKNLQDQVAALMLNDLLHTLIAQLLRWSHADVSQRSEPLTPATLAQLDDDIEAYGDQDLSLAKLAQVAGCSPFYLAHR